MPIYEYECQSCHQIQEVFQGLRDPAPEMCSACGKGPLKKVMSLSSFALKGSGWYTTDYKRAPSKPESSSGSKGSSD